MVETWWVAARFSATENRTCICSLFLARSRVGGVSFGAMTRVGFKMEERRKFPGHGNASMLLSLLRDGRRKLHRLPGGRQRG
jgi:hypothetical protein